MKLLLVVCCFFSLNAFCATTRFVALGDVPYAMPQDDARFVKLIEQTNKLNPDFAVHVGDIKAGSTPCTDDSLNFVYQRFQTFTVPLVYTPGDNEWTDCHRAGGDPLERLDFVRKLFFKNPFSLGAPTLSLTRQSAIFPAQAKFVENARWSQNKVAYATLHVVGSNNNFDPENKIKTAEFTERNAATIAWLKDTAALATKENSSALIVFMQADPLFFEKAENRTGYEELLQAFLNMAIEFKKPFLLVHGDTHQFIFDRPLYKGEYDLVDNFMRLEVPGAPYVQSVLVTVDPESEQPFTVQLQPKF